MPGFSAKVTPIDALALERSSASEAIDLAEELARVAYLCADAEEEVGRETESTVPSSDVELFEEPLAITLAEPEETPGTVAAEESPLPAGMVDQSILARCLETDRPFGGTVVAIGVGGLEDAPWEEKSAAELVQSLLEENDLGCRTADDEFLLIFPNDSGAAGQRRIQHVSQRLWDHQIRSVGRSPIMFSWGATDTADDTLAATIESARERMDQTRRNRARFPNKIHQYRAVNN